MWRVIQLAAIRACAGRRTQVQVLVIDALFGFCVQIFRAEHDTKKRQFMFEAQIRFPDRGLPKRRVDEVHIGCRCSSRKAGRLGVRIGAENAAGDGTGRKTECAATHYTGGNAGVLELIGKPDVCRSTLKQPEATAHLRGTSTVKGIVESEARLDQITSIDGESVIPPETA